MTAEIASADIRYDNGGLIVRADVDGDLSFRIYGEPPDGSAERVAIGVTIKPGDILKIADVVQAAAWQGVKIA